MGQPPNDPWLGAMMTVVVAASVFTWITLIARRLRGQPWLAYEPRTPVPWGAPVAMLAVLFVAIALLTAIGAETDAAPPEPSHPLEIVERLVGFIFIQSIVIGGILFVVAVLYKPSLRDLGLPVYADELVRDIRIGIVACLAAVAPVYGVQFLMLLLFGPSKHPLVEMVIGGEPSIGVALLASIAAVIVAPVGEEILFRLLLQGWLEKWQSRRFGKGVEMQNDEARMTNDELAAAAASSADDSSFVIRHSSFEDSSFENSTPSDEPTPTGWFPILISSLLFAIAHFGHGPDPIALFLLAIVLGYVYHRTHRIVPCIVAHAMFNSLAMFVLWRFVFLHAE